MREPPLGGVGAMEGYMAPRGDAGGVGSTRPLSDLPEKKVPIRTHTAEERRREERYSSSVGCSHCSSSRLDVPARRGEPCGPLPGMVTSGDSGDGDESITPAGR
ncbi:hypothetical protein E2C01_058990 [Portunus trituberculatus]|uniref:Uncharacterized protein n=1 Tax=Portunus trituberculatus TaxID=210409 RepID=A0A5B7H4W5_PORTR|nr:hypothetical protein [Portunus trituberculatus]